ncbi:hypothetical protein AB0L00_04900 [Actinoallomurus sp. NPDC052308]|uniref:hypothetical protein n=1 Tax=Actinoallomurus sp. NPDC052308 TaxID=3155530 RepID=UPI00342378AA
MPTTTPDQGRTPGRAQLWPLYAAGFTTAFGAHSVAANLGRFTTGHHDSASRWVPTPPALGAERHHRPDDLSRKHLAG